MATIEPRDPGTSDSGFPAWPASDSVAPSREPAAPPEPGAAPGSAAGELAPAAEADPLADRQAALRALRNLEATEARLARNARREADDMRAKLVQELLPVLDNLDRTLRAAHNGRSDPAMVEGVRMVRHQLEGVLRGYGVERIDAFGQRFDPAIHEAIGMSAVDDPDRNGAVVHQAEPGYRFAGRLLRPAKVTVGKFVESYGLRPAAYWR
jgi:molecular chaperone GrpE (heat shock protein)